MLSSLPEYQPVPVIDGFWNWYRTYNTGAAFSFLSDAGGWQKWFFVALALAICGLLVWMAGAHAAQRLARGAALCAGDRRRAGQRDRPVAARPRDRLHPVVRGRPLLAGVQHRRLRDRGRRGRHRPVRLFDGKCCQCGTMPPIRSRLAPDNLRHGCPARQSPWFLRRRRSRHRDRQARDRDPRCADLRAPRGGAQPLRGR